LVQFRYSIEDGQAGAGGALSIIFVRFGPAEIGHDAVAEIFGDLTAVTCDGFRRAMMITAYQVAPFFRIELSRNFSRANEITEQHS
jgi:hypothetical protein